MAALSRPLTQESYCHVPCAVRRFLAEHPAEFDPRKFLAKTTTAMRDICVARYEAFNTAGKASSIRVKSLDAMHIAYEAGELTPAVN